MNYQKLVNIIGIDNSSEAIKLAKKKAVESNLNPNIFQEVVSSSLTQQDNSIA
ncbi:class I SAM-dependent methyltransferase [Clostridium neonatale]|uniref:Uncharacterized protein n=1 Tax=Clostridium neonatale TaxID=137838 RepID=A0AA86JBD8_9CLOT|nr:hypothetical protein CNEO_30009 [Clostridium neonatale]